MKRPGKEKLVVALDVESIETAEKLVEELKDYVGVFKIGSQLFTSLGPEIIRRVQQKGGRVFLDLKYHDIPNTVAKAGEIAVREKVFIFDVHASGGFGMMKAAAEAAQKKAKELRVEKPLLLGVTILTSIVQEVLEEELRVRHNIRTHVVHLASLAKGAGLEGVVASPWEVASIREACGKDFLILTPGIRPGWASKNDHRRVMTPGEAISAGADFIVIGRPIIQAPQPREAAKKILEEME
jgi:orotidine-5'-phosphate decarboxylase